MAKTCGECRLDPSGAGSIWEKKCHLHGHKAGGNEARSPILPVSQPREGSGSWFGLGYRAPPKRKLG